MVRWQAAAQAFRGLAFANSRPLRRPSSSHLVLPISFPERILYDDRIAAFLIPRSTVIPGSGRYPGAVRDGYNTGYADAG